MDNPQRETGIIAWMARNPVAANLLMWVVFAAGIHGLFNVTKEVWPTSTPHTLSIIVPYPGSSPEEVEEGIILKVEEAIQDIVGIKEMRSLARDGSGEVKVEFESNIDIADVLNEVKVRVDGITSFPGEAEPPIIQENIISTRVINLTLIGDVDERQLKLLGEEMRDELLALPGITQVSLDGTRNYEIAIEVSSSALRQYGLQFDDVVAAIRSQSRDLPGGKMRTEEGVISLRSMGQAQSAGEFAALTLLTRNDGTQVTVGDVARVIDGFEDQPLLHRLNGQDGISLEISRVGRQSAIAISQQVRDYAQQKAASLPEGLELQVWADRTDTLKSRVNLLLRSAAQGVLLVMIALALFLKTSLAFWVVMGLPFCFLGALAVMNIHAVDMSINVISLFGFILVLGILVDDAIVTSESAYTYLEREQKGVESIIRGVKRVSVPTVFGILTTVLAFMPILFVEEGIGHIFGFAAPVIIICLLFSLIETKLILPAHLRHMHIATGPVSEHWWSWSRLQRRFGDGMKHFAEHRYQPFLFRVVRYRYISLAVFIAIFIVSIALVTSGVLRTVFFPSVPSDRINVSLIMPQTVSYHKTHEVALRLEKAALAMNERYRQREGRDVIEELRVSSTNDSEASLTAQLIPSTERQITSVELAGWWREEIGELSGIKSLSLDSSVGFSGTPISIELRGGDLDDLRSAAEELKSALREIEGVYDVVDTFEAGGVEVDIRITDEGRALGLGQAELARQVRQAFFGAEVQRLQRGRHEVRVYVRFPAEQRQSLETLRSMWIQIPGGARVPFEVVGEIVESTGINYIRRVDRQRVVVVAADVDKTHTSPAEITALLEAEALPQILAHHPAIDYHLAGEAEEQEENTSSLIAGTSVMLILIFAALAIPLKSYGQPLIIMAMIPFGVVGAIWGHLLLGKPLSVISFVGIIALCGVVVNDSLVLVDYINHRVAEGLARSKAILEAGVRRFRAVVLTSVTTFAGLLPIQLETSIQAQFLKPMAISISFGVMFASFITLLLVPVLCFIVDDVAAWWRAPRSDTSPRGS